jgi:hypothetical protein
MASIVLPKAGKLTRLTFANRGVLGTTSKATVYTRPPSSTGAPTASSSLVVQLASNQQCASVAGVQGVVDCSLLAVKVEAIGGMCDGAATVEYEEF